MIAVSHVGKGVVMGVVDPWFYNEYADGRKMREYDGFESAGYLAAWAVKQASAVETIVSAGWRRYWAAGKSVARSSVVRGETGSGCEGGSPRKSCSRALAMSRSRGGSHVHAEGTGEFVGDGYAFFTVCLRERADCGGGGDAVEDVEPLAQGGNGAAAIVLRSGLRSSAAACDGLHHSFHYES